MDTNTISWLFLDDHNMALHIWSLGLSICSEVLNPGISANLPLLFVHVTRTTDMVCVRFVLHYGPISLLIHNRTTFS